MMEDSPNQNHHGFSSIPPPFLHTLGRNHDQWDPNLILNTSDEYDTNDTNANGNLPSLKDLIVPMTRDLENYMNYSTHQVPLATIKEELPTSVLRKVGEVGFINPSSIYGLWSSTGGNFGTVLPSMNIMRPNPDLLANSAKFGWTRSQPNSNTTMALFGESTQEPSSYCHHEESSSINGDTGTRRGNGILPHKASQEAAKSNPFEPRSLSSPFKVRKEKLGDRIAALQQLVAPFGKTDTASVLMEAIGYIKFLQDQVETLSVPYMRSSNNKKLRTTQGGSSEDHKECKPDLRSRGLCLVPLPCMSYITDGNGGVWTLPNF